MSRPLTWWYLSFVSETEWLGGTCVLAPEDDLEAAIREAWHHDINPGGTVAAAQLPITPDERFRYRLFNQRTDPGEEFVPA